MTKSELLFGVPVFAEEQDKRERERLAREKINRDYKKDSAL